MASLSKSADGVYTVQFFDLQGKRRTIRLGKEQHEAAELIKIHIGNIVEDKHNGDDHDAGTVKWLRKIDHKLHAKLADKELARSRDKPVKENTLAEWLDRYVAMKSDKKQNDAQSL